MERMASCREEPFLLARHQSTALAPAKHRP